LEAKELIFAVVYILMGFLFTYLAITSDASSVFDLTTMLLILLAALDFGVGIRYINLYFKAKKETDEE